MKRILAFLMFLTVTSVALTSCSISDAREAAVTAAHGPPDTALPYQAVFAVSESADERLVFAAKNFCGRAAEFSQGSSVFEFILSKNPLNDLYTGKADVILLENSSVSEFSPMSEAFRYKNYEHFSMTANSAETLRMLSDILGANVFAGFYAGSNIILSHGTLDSRFRTPNRNTDSERQPAEVPVAALTETAAYAFSLLNSDVNEARELDARIAAFANPGSVVEFSHSELDSPALLEAVRASAESNNAVSGDESDGAETVPIELDPPVLTRAFTGIQPVWLIFSQTSYEKLSQTNRAAVAEAAAYMLPDIDGVYLKYEQEKIDALAAEDVLTSPDFAATRAQVLRLADEQVSRLTVRERKLREIISRVQ